MVTKDFQVDLWEMDKARVHDKSPRFLGGLGVAPTGVDPVTSRFSVVRSTN